MNSTSNSHENADKHDESADQSDNLNTETSDESSSEEPVVIEGEATEVDEIEENSEGSEDETENFPPSDDIEEEISEAVEETVQPVAEPEPRRGSIVPMAFGGLLAGAIGFGAAYFLPGLSGQADQMSTVAETVESNSSSLAGLTSRIEEIGGSIPAPTDTSALEGSVSSLESGLSEFGGNVAALEDRLAVLETAIGGLTSEVDTLKGIPQVDLSGLSADIASLGDRITALEIEEGNAESAQAQSAKEQLEAFQAELQASVDNVQSQIDTAVAGVNDQIAAAVLDAQNQIDTAEEKAAAVEEAAAEREALAKKKSDLAELKSAVDSGADFSSLVSAMDDVPAEIADHAKDGIPTLDVLQRQFPDVARVALGSVQSIPEDASTGQRLTAFLKRQTNARSVTPKDGDDPDAVLSRAQSLLGEGDLSAALAEVETLPEEAQEAMAGWLTDAKIRQSALDAVDALSQKLN